MKIQKNNLQNALRLISAFVDRPFRRIAIPILIEAKTGIVTLTVCNEQNIGIFSFPVRDKSEIAFVTEYSRLRYFTGLREDCDWECENNTLTIREGHSERRLTVGDSNTFVRDVEIIRRGGVIRISSSKFKKLITKVFYARKKKDARPFATGIRLSFDGKNLKAEATDALRVLRDYTTLEGFENQSFCGVLSAKCIEIIKRLSRGKELIIQMTKNNILLQTDDMCVYMKNLNCPYPDTSRFFASEAPATFALEKQKVLDSLGILAAFDGSELRCTRKGNKVLFSMQNGSSYVQNEIEMESFSDANFDFRTDFNRFREIFKNFKGGNSVVFYWQEASHFIGFKDAENMEGVFMV